MTFGFVRQSGGYLLIESAPDKGTAITILMPRDTEEPA
jgi:signal transduction histidine kinase